MTIRTSEQAKEAVQSDAAARALLYIEREIPSTLEAITFWISEGRSEVDIMDEIVTAYDITEERVQHKIGLVVAAAIRERDDV